MGKHSAGRGMNGSAAKQRANRQQASQRSMGQASQADDVMLNDYDNEISGERTSGRDQSTFDAGESGS